MIQTIISIAIFALIIDGVKLLIESRSKIIERVGKSNPNETTIVTSAYNEYNIIESIQTLKPHAKKLIIVNDNSTDDTLSKLKSLGTVESVEILDTQTHIKVIDNDTNYLIIDNHSNLGKVPSIHYALDFVDTKYTFICDADIYLSDDFTMPSSLLEKDEIDSVSFSILPKTGNSKSIWTNILIGLQLHEYHKSMNIGRQFANNSKSVECISGAAGLFKTHRITKLKNVHSNEFCGEDLERTLLELFDKGKSVFSDQVIETDVPETLRQLTHQRVTGWWPGLFRTFPLIFKIFRTKGMPNRLRFEMLYNMISVILDPLKLISLWLVFLVVNIPVLISLYIVYLLFEIYIFFRIKKRTIYEIKYSPIQIILYPLYGILQLHYRILAMIRLIYMKLRKKVKPLQYKKLLTTTILLITLLSVSTADVYSQDVITSTEYSQYNLSNSDEWNPNYNLSLYIGDYYGILNYGLYDQINIGTYQGRFLLDVGVREESITPTAIYTHWIGNGFLRGTLRYNYNNVDNPIYPNSTAIGVGYGHYSEQHELVRFNVDVYKRFDYNNPYVLTVKTTQPISENLHWKKSISINSDRHYSLGTSINYRGLYVMGAFQNDFEYTNQEYLKLGMGLTINF